MLQVQPVSRRKLQLVGVTAMLVACKYEEMYAPEVGDFAYITDNAFTKAQILEMEQVVLKTLNFELGRPLPLHFLRRASKVASVSFGTTSQQKLKCRWKSFGIFITRPPAVNIHQTSHDAETLTTEILQRDTCFYF